MPINWELTIGSLVRLRETQTDHEGTYFIIGEAQELARGGVHWTTTWYLEPQVETLPWRLDDSQPQSTGYERLSGVLEMGFGEMRRLVTGRASSH